MVRLAASGGTLGLGLAMSEEGGLDEVEEFFLALASCACNDATSASELFTRVCRLPQFAQDGVDAPTMPLFHLNTENTASPRERLPFFHLRSAFRVPRCRTKKGCWRSPPGQRSGACQTVDDSAHGLTAARVLTVEQLSIASRSSAVAFIRGIDRAIELSY